MHYLHITVFLLCKEENLYKSILLNSLLKTMLKMLKYNNYILI